jgi:hypothetical protein
LERIVDFGYVEEKHYEEFDDVVQEFEKRKVTVVE